MEMILLVIKLLILYYYCYWGGAVWPKIHITFVRFWSLLKRNISCYGYEGRKSIPDTGILVESVCAVIHTYDFFQVPSYWCHAESTADALRQAAQFLSAGRR